MKYLTDYMQEAQTNLFNQVGAFFAYNKEQLNAGRTEGETYTTIGEGFGGLFCPQGQLDKLINGLEDIRIKGIAQDIAENGKEKIIERELNNYECFYTHDISFVVWIMADYGYTHEDVKAVFDRLAGTIQA